MFEPISGTPYLTLNPDLQLLVCSLSEPKEARATRWASKACAIFEFPADGVLLDIVRDILANPQIRCIVFDGTGAGRDVFREFWDSKSMPDWSIKPEHVKLVRQFVDLYDDDCGFRPLQPFWPERLKYLVTQK
jgi:hypothetical protein